MKLLSIIVFIVISSNLFSGIEGGGGGGQTERKLKQFSQFQLKPGVFKALDKNLSLSLHGVDSGGGNGGTYSSFKLNVYDIRELEQSADLKVVNSFMTDSGVLVEYDEITDVLSKRQDSYQVQDLLGFKTKDGSFFKKGEIIDVELLERR